MTTRVVIPDWLPAQLANGSHGHWSTRRKALEAAQRTTWAFCTNADLAGVPPTTRARLTVTLVFPVHRRRDTDNLYSRVKGVVDGLVRGGWIVDDDIAHLELRVRAEVARGRKSTVIDLEPC
jgi:Holliday junction resolvase RusA-like endonuclease